MPRYKRFSAVLLTLVLSCFLLSISVVAFSDVSEEAWFADYVSYVSDHGLFRGVDHTSFSPDTTMTRGMFVTVLCRADGSQGGDFPDSGFTDVPEEQYYSTAVNWGKSTGLVKGMSETTFEPDLPVSREQICTLVYRYAQYVGFSLPETVDTVSFTDQERIGVYAQEAVSVCQRAGLINGYPDGSFQPQSSASRAEVAAIFTRLGQMLEDDGRQVGPGPVDLSDWRLILVNRWNPIPAGYVDSLELRSTPWGEKVDARMYDDCMAMMQALSDAGISAYIDSGFRTNAIQQFLFQRKVNQYISYGYSYASAEALAEQWVARPGTSEHEVGLALDISMYASNADMVHGWLAENAWRYGFIYRYPSGSEAVTGVNNEPWHYRYVGREYAEMIYNSGLTLEEFLAQYQ